MTKTNVYYQEYFGHNIAFMHTACKCTWWCSRALLSIHYPFANLCVADNKDSSTTKEDLVGCLASIADMANTGHGTALPHGAPSSGACAAPPTPPEGVLKMNSKLRRRLESLKGTSDDLEMIESLMKLVSNICVDWGWHVHVYTVTPCFHGLCFVRPLFVTCSGTNSRLLSL